MTTVGTHLSLPCPTCGFANIELWDVNPTEDENIRVHCDWCDSPILISLLPGCEGTLQANECL